MQKMGGPVAHYACRSLAKRLESLLFSKYSYVSQQIRAQRSSGELPEATAQHALHQVREHPEDEDHEGRNRWTKGQAHEAW